MPAHECPAAAAGTFALGDLGVNHVDTAAFYRSPGGILDGEPGPTRYATELVREVLGSRDDVVVATKVGPGITADGEFYQATTADQLRRQVEGNPRRLGRDWLDVVNLRIIKKQGHDSVTERFEALPGRCTRALMCSPSPARAMTPISTRTWLRQGCALTRTTSRCCPERAPRPYDADASAQSSVLEAFERVRHDASCACSSWSWSR